MLLFARRISALVLLLLWLPATLHCALEVIGAVPDTCQNEPTQSGTTENSSDGCDSDGCKVVETGLYRSTPIVLNVAATPLFCTCLLYLPPFEPDSVTEPVLSSDRHPEPLELTRTWQFRERAAPPSRAPSLVS